MQIEKLNNRKNAFSKAVENEVESIMKLYAQNSEEFYVFDDCTEELKSEYKQYDDETISVFRKRLPNARTKRRYSIHCRRQRRCSYFRGVTVDNAA